MFKGIVYFKLSRGYNVVRLTLVRCKDMVNCLYDESFLEENDRLSIYLSIVKIAYQRPVLSMKYLIVLFLPFLFSCASEYERSTQVIERQKDTIATVDAIKANAQIVQEVSDIFLDGIGPGAELTPQQMVKYFGVDTAYYQLFNITSSLLGAKLLGDSLLVAVVQQADNNCSKAFVYILNRYSYNKTNEMMIEEACDMDNQAADYITYEFTDRHDFIVTTSTYDKGANSDSPSVVRKEYWTVSGDGQFQKRKPDEESRK